MDHSSTPSIIKRDFNEIFNNGSPTHLSTFQSLTHIDLTICSPIIATSTQWDIEKTFWEAMTFQLCYQCFLILKPPINLITQVIVLKKENSEKFVANCFVLSREEITYREEVAKICQIIHQAANNSIPILSKPKKNRSVPWWSYTLQKVKANKNKLWHNFR